MPIIARDILTPARVILQDGGSTRWPLTELVTWLNAGLRELPMRMPSSTSTNFVLAMVAGTKQTLPDAYASLIRVRRNVTGVFPSHVGSMAVTPIVREILDAQNPHWHDPVRTPFRPMVRHVMSDPYDQRTFYVYPGNDGTGQVECVLSAIPVAVAVVGMADPEDIDSYGMTIALQSIFQSALVDYVLYRAFSKDMQLAGAADRAGAHYGQFTATLDTKAALEGMANVNTTQTQPNS